jgi:hypothetical protein
MSRNMTPCGGSLITVYCLWLVILMKLCKPPGFVQRIRAGILCEQFFKLFPGRGIIPRFPESDSKPKESY